MSEFARKKMGEAATASECRHFGSIAGPFGMHPGQAPDKIQVAVVGLRIRENNGPKAGPGRFLANPRGSSPQGGLNTAGCANRNPNLCHPSELVGVERKWAQKATSWLPG